ncbi:unnamed protein product [Didymodactylos carnosus]|uniref:Uncharacterized protein n=1 Tax=Didymodactylos carnosus TaxID=1234261 RepID=A0A815WU76_9BILA|nr:unnamed protein product [Didymodactylos carnosus]CAF4413134.1 unnamed protein product [Didymodactylos carnosus]CAF4557651.1 unnamed protein product [Didymodactylos carnosus]
MNETKTAQQEELNTQHALRRTSSASSTSSIPRALSPLRGRFHRQKIFLTEMQRDTIRLTFHLLLEDKVYPTLKNILSTLLAQDPDFPIKKITRLREEMKRLGFKYGQTRKAPVLLDSTPFQAQ